MYFLEIHRNESSKFREESNKKQKSSLRDGLFKIVHFFYFSDFVFNILVEKSNKDKGVSNEAEGQARKFQNVASNGKTIIMQLGD